MELEYEVGICKKKARELRILSDKVIKMLEKMEETDDVILEIKKIKGYKFTECECGQVNLNVKNKLKK
jgi:hypothetical protein